MCEGGYKGQKHSGRCCDSLVQWFVIRYLHLICPHPAEEEVAVAAWHSQWPHVSSTYASAFAAAATTDGTTRLRSGEPVPLARPPSSGGRWQKWVPGCTLLVEVTACLSLGPSHSLSLRPTHRPKSHLPPFPQWPTHSQECRDADHTTFHPWSASLHSHLPTPRKFFLVNLRCYIFY